MKICELCKLEKKLNQQKNLCVDCYKNYKKCLNCNYIKLHDEFHQRKNYRLAVYCKECFSFYGRNRYKNNKKIIDDNNKRYYENNKDKINKNNRQYYQNNKIEIRNSQNNYIKNKIKNDPIFKFMKNFSNQINIILKSQGLSKNGKSSQDKLPSFHAEKYIQHIESLWVEEMSWENHGPLSKAKKTWQIDHIIPQSFLKYSSYDDLNFKICWDKENLRPLWAIDNLIKKDKLTEEAKILLQKLTEKYSK